MKKFKFLLVFALVLTMISTVAFAADSAVIDGATNNEIIYAGTGALEVSVVSNGDFETDSAQAWIVFDQDKWTVSSASTSVAGGTAVVNASTGQPSMSCLAMASLAKGDKIIAATFTPVDGANVIGSEFKVYTYWYDADSYDEIVTNNVVYTVKADTPVVNKYNVTFTGYESKNMTDVEENTEITLPAAPAVDKNKEFVGWSDGTTTYEAGAKYTVTGNVTFTAVINDITLPTPVVTKEGIISAEVEGKTYTDIFEGIYTLTPGKASLTKFGVKIPGKLNPADVREFATSGTFEGEGTFVYRVALFGVMNKADIAAIPFAE